MEWNVDPSHSSIEFAVRHMGLSTVRGRFTSFDADIEADENGVPEKVDVTIDVDSITSGDKDRDAHLRSADFFDAESHPEMRFESREIRRNGHALEIVGDLAIRGTTRPVTFEADLSEGRPDPFGNLRAAVVGEAQINRKDWGLTWNQVLEAGSLLVGEEVRISIDLQAVVPLEAVQDAQAREREAVATN